MGMRYTRDPPASVVIIWTASIAVFFYLLVLWIGLYNNNYNFHKALEFSLGRVKMVLVFALGACILVIPLIIGAVITGRINEDHEEKERRKRFKNLGSRRHEDHTRSKGTRYDRTR